MVFWQRKPAQTGEPEFTPPPIDLKALATDQLDSAEDFDRPTLERHPEWIDRRPEWRERMQASGHPVSAEAAYTERMDRLRLRLEQLPPSPYVPLAEMSVPVRDEWVRDNTPTEPGHYFVRARDGLAWIRPARVRLVHLSESPNGLVIDAWANRLARCIPADWSGPVEFPEHLE